MGWPVVSQYKDKEENTRGKKEKSPRNVKKIKISKKEENPTLFHSPRENISKK